MTLKERASCINTIELLKRMAFNVHGLMDVVDAENCDKIIKMLNDDKSHWTPCSERLPSDDDYDDTFTVTIQCEHYDGWDDYVTGYADWTPHGWDIQSYYLGQIKVVAWMPLPEPHRGESDE